MALRHRELLAISLLLLLVGSASRAPARDARPAADAARAAAPKLTGKERLGRKWTDEQRIDNCKVPLDKRGNKPRPGACSNDPPD